MKEIFLEGKKIIVNYTVDAVGLHCPLPIVWLKREIEKGEINSVIEFFCDDQGILDDLPAWCKETGNRLLSLQEKEDNLFVAYVMKERE